MIENLKAKLRLIRMILKYYPYCTIAHNVHFVSGKTEYGLSPIYMSNCTVEKRAHIDGDTSKFDKRHFGVIKN
jgi:hypothetical protein